MYPANSKIDLKFAKISSFGRTVTSRLNMTPLNMFIKRSYHGIAAFIVLFIHLHSTVEVSSVDLFQKSNVSILKLLSSLSPTDLWKTL